MKVEIELSGDRKNDFCQIGLINSNGGYSVEFVFFTIRGLAYLEFFKKVITMMMIILILIMSSQSQTYLLQVHFVIICGFAFFSLISAECIEITAKWL